VEDGGRTAEKGRAEAREMEPEGGKSSVTHHAQFSGGGKKKGGTNRRANRNKRGRDCV